MRIKRERGSHLATNYRLEGLQRLLMHHRRGTNGGDVEPSMIDAPSNGAPEQAPRWDLVGTEGCSGGIRVFGSVSDRLGVRRYI